MASICNTCGTTTCGDPGTTLGTTGGISEDLPSPLLVFAAIVVAILWVLN